VTARILVHSLADANAALAAASALKLPVTLASVPGAAGHAGPAWFKSLVEQAAARHPGVAMDAVLDCGAEAGTALAALRLGLKRVGFSGPEAARARLGEIARALGGEVDSAAPGPALDLRGRKNKLAAARAYLAGETVT
jgi:hypothetical protein